MRNEDKIKEYLEQMRNEYKRMARSYGRYLAYKHKLTDELETTEEDRAQLAEIEEDFKTHFVGRVLRRLAKE